MAMRSIYTGTKADGSLAIAIDMSAIRDEKTLGKFLQLAAEASLVIDRVEPWQVEFMAPIIHRTEPAEDRSQMVIDFSKPAAGERGGPAEMDENFSCTFSGPCPNEKKSCAQCEYGKGGLAVTAGQAASPAAEEVPVVGMDLAAPDTTDHAAVIEVENTPNGTLVTELEQSPFMEWAGEPPEGEIPTVPEEERIEVIYPDEHDLEHAGQDDDEVAAFDQALADSQEAAA
jgi:hypothetical protein